MCGICGFTSASRLSGKSRAALEAMTGSMEHRGPDDSGFYLDDYIALGFRRLGIIDLDTGGQPLSDENDRYRMVFNGEIYNYKQLRRELQGRGHRFKSQTDSEVIIHLYEERGENCVKALRGMFAFAIYDTVEQRLFLARDRFGIKPLYYTVLDGSLIFASEAKTLLEHPAVEARLNLEVLPHYFTFQYIPDPDTIFSGIMRLRPAHHLTLDSGGIALKKYWQIRFNPQSDRKSLTHYIEMTDYLLREAVRLHMLSDVPRGAFLSSGIDSSNIVALLSQYEDVRTYSVGCEGGKYDELPQAGETAAFLGTTHREVRVGAREFWDQLPRIIWHQDEPVADPAAIALYFVARLAAEEVRVVLSGEGADEIFGGYDIYREPAAVAPVQMLPEPLKNALSRMSQRLPDSIRGKNYINRATTPLEQRYYGNARIFTEAEKDDLLNPALFPDGRRSPLTVTAPYFNTTRHLDATTRMQHLDIHTWMPGDIMAKADRMTMAHSLELRVPYLDHKLVEFAATIPARFKIHRHITKFLLRKAASRHLPEEVFLRPKLGFPVPIAGWIRDYYRPRLEELFQNEAARTFFNRPVLERMLEQHCRGDADYGRKLWTVAIFLLWHEIYLQ